MSDDFQKKVEAALRDPKNLGELADADAVGSAGSAGCGDMIRLWIKFKEEAGRKVVDRATFQGFGCETAIAVASLVTERIRGKTPDEALALKAEDLAPELGPLPPVKIHCTQLVESALQSALRPGPPAEAAPSPTSLANGPSLFDKFAPSQTAGKLKIVLLKPGEE